MEKQQQPITLSEYRRRTRQLTSALYGLPDVQVRPITDFVARVKLSQARVGEAREKIRAAYSHDEEGA